MDDSLRMLPSLLMTSCTAFEFGDPLLTPAPLWPGQPPAPCDDGVVSLHPNRRHGPSPARQAPLVTATIYPLHPLSAPQPTSRYAYGVPFSGATVRCTRQGVTVYRTSDRAFLVDVRWIDVKELKRHVPSDDPSLTEVALVFSRGILVMDVASPYVAAGLWAALEHCRVLTDARVVEALRSSAWSATLGGDGMEGQQRLGTPPSTAVPSSERELAVGGHTPGDEREAQLVRRAQEVLERFLGPNHNLTITSPQGRRGDHAHVSRSEAPLSLLHASTPPPLQSALRTDVTSPSDSPHDAATRPGGSSMMREDDDPFSRRSQVSARDRADHIRREQDEQLQRLRRREEEMRRDIHHTSHSRSTTRSQSNASTSIGISGNVRTASPDVAAQDRRRKAAAAARSESHVQRVSPSAPRAASSSARAELPIIPKPVHQQLLPPTHAFEHRAPSVAASHASGTSRERDALHFDSQSRYDSNYGSIARTAQRDELTSDISSLMDSLEASARAANAGATAQSKRVTEVLRIALPNDTPQRDLLTPATAAPSELPVASANNATSATAGPVAAPATVSERTPVVEAPTPPAAVPARAAQYVGHWSSRTAPDGRTYFYNTQTRVTTWKRQDTDLPPEHGTDVDASSPVKGNAGGAGSKQAAVVATQAQPQEPGRGWKAVMSDKGKTYYVHAASKKTTWNIEDTLPSNSEGGAEEGSPQPARAAATPSTPGAESMTAASGGSARRTATAGNSSGTTTATPTVPRAAAKSETPNVTSEPVAAHIAAPTSQVKGVEAQTPLVHSEKESSEVPHASVIQDPEDVRKENEARKKAAQDKLEQDKKTIRIGGMTMMEALMQEQQAMLRGSSGATPAPLKESKAPLEQTSVAAKGVVEEAAQTPSGEQRAASSAPTESPAAATPQRAPVVAPGGNQFGDWKELYHKESKRTYYRNVATNASTWHMPDEVRAMKDALAAREAAAHAQHAPTHRKDDSSAMQRAASMESESSPSNGRNAVLRIQGVWSEKVDPKSGRHYYANSETKQSTWKIEETPFSSANQ